MSSFKNGQTTQHYDRPPVPEQPEAYAAALVTGREVIDPDDEVFLSTLAQLDELRARVAKRHGTQKLNMILDAPEPRALVQRMPAQEFLATIKDIGKGDCAELIEMATDEQIKACVDLDCWKKDTILPEALDDWVKYLVAGEILAAERILRNLDIETLVFYSMDFFRPYYRVDEDAPEHSVGDIIDMPDTHYIVEIPYEADHPRSTIGHALLHLFMGYGYSFYHRMFEWILWGQKSDLEEIAYQFRKARVEEHGFFDYYEAIGLYQPLPVKSEPPMVLPYAYPNEAIPVHVSVRPEGLFGRAYQKLDDEDTRTRIRRELMFLGNKVMAADQVDPGHPQAVEQSLRAIQRTLDIGVEYLTGADALETGEAVVLLSSRPLEWIFRSGFSAYARMRRQANLIARDERLSLVEKAPLSLLPSPYMEVMQALRQLKPRYYTGLERTPGTMRPFRSLEEIERSKQALRTISLLAPLFFESFGFSHEALKQWVEEERLASPLYAEDIHFSHLFLTGLAQMSLQGSFQLAPLTAEQVKVFLNQIFIPAEEPPHQVDPAFQARIEEELLRRPDTDELEAQSLRAFLEGVWETLREQAAYLPLPLKEAPEPAFLQLFLIAKEE